MVAREVGSTLERTVDEGEHRLHRSWAALLATGAVGGIDIAIGVLALLLVKQGTGSELLAALAFGIGFLALEMAHSELFTENFLVPVAAVVAGRAGTVDLLRLWLGTLVMNLAGGWVMIGAVMLAFPRLHPTAVEVGSTVPDLGFGLHTFMLAVVAGAVMTLMTWMTHGTESVFGATAAVLAAAFLLAAGPLNHAIVVSVEAFGALQVGAGFGYLHWLGTLGWAALGNLVGGIGLVTVLRLVQARVDKLPDPGTEPEARTAEDEQPA